MSDEKKGTSVEQVRKDFAGSFGFNINDKKFIVEEE